ncbi:MAG: PAS domain S-box protein [Thermodesulfovibrionales bacterium]|nr:PAS domain S-box protein [Thermodesulfovibrionales bacterium]
MHIRQEGENIFQAINHPTIILDVQYNIISVNRATVKAVGAISAKELIYRKCYEIFHNSTKPPENCPLIKMLASTKPEANEMEVEALDGVFLVSCTPVFDEKGNIQKIIHIAIDITEQKRTEALMHLRLELMQYASTHSLEELLQRTLDEVGALIDSPIGFYHFVEPDQKTLSLQAWSTRTMKEFCMVKGKGMHYGIDQAGVWVDCIHQRRPVIHNDYHSLPHRKGLPEGHAAVIRELVVPIMRADRIVAVLGIGNKPKNYTKKDVEIVSFMADVVWEIIEHKRSEEAKREREEKLQSIFRVAPTGIGLVRDRILLDVNLRICEMTGYGKEELLGKSARIFYPTQKDFEYVGTEKYRQIAERGTGVVETRWMKKDGTIIDVILASTPLDLNDLSKGVTFTALDITKRKRAEQAQRLNESRISALLELSRMTNQPDQMLTDFALEKAIELTHSTIGYLAFMNEDETVLTMYSWSRQAMQECMIEKKPIVYPVETTGLWGEPVRQRKPLITNDYQAPNPFKKGYPKGHVHVKRHMNIPLFDGASIVLVAGVGNKEYPYEESDIRQLTLLMDGMWKIIKQKRVGEALRYSEEKYHSAIDNAGDMILLADLDGNLQEVNKKAQELLGYTKEELTAMHYSMIHPMEELERISDAFAEIILKGRIYFKDSIILRKDGTTIPVDITGSLIAYAGKLLVQGIFSDRTEQKRKEDDIKYALSLQKSTIESTADGILVVDRRGKIVSFNQKFLEMWHIPRNVIDSRDDAQSLSFVLEQLKNPESFLSKVEELYAHPNETSYDVIEFKDGRYFERYSQPQEIEGNILGRVWSFRDITERKKAEDELKKNEKELQKRVEELEEFYNMAVGRELRMVELKNEIERLKKDLEKKKNQ